MPDFWLNHLYAMLPRRPLPSTLRTFFALAFPIVIAACGGGGGSGVPDPGTPAPPPVEPPVTTFPTNFPAARAAIGQADLEGVAPNQGRGPGDQTLNSPAGIAVTPEGGLLVSDTGNNRVLLFARVPEASGATAIRVLGQGGFETSAASVAKNGLTRPQGLGVGNGKFAIADTDANRVLIYDRAPAEGSVVPEPLVVIGQQDFDTATGDCAPDKLQRPQAAVITPDNKLIVADTNNNRILIWNTVPGTIPAPSPNIVLGQSDLDRCEPNDSDDDGFPGPDVTSQTLALPTDIWSDGKRLVVADLDNNRVLIWDDIETATNFQAAMLVLGQRDFSRKNANDGDDPFDSSGVTAKTLHFPEGVHSDGTSLAVTDTSNNRVLIWKSFPSTNFQAADVVLGHADFETRLTSDESKAKTLQSPIRALLTPHAVIVSDRSNHRVLVFGR